MWILNLTVILSGKTMHTIKFYCIVKVLVIISAIKKQNPKYSRIFDVWIDWRLDLNLSNRVKIVYNIRRTYTTGARFSENKYHKNKVIWFYRSHSVIFLYDTIRRCFNSFHLQCFNKRKFCTDVTIFRATTRWIIYIEYLK